MASLRPRRAPVRALVLAALLLPPLAAQEAAWFQPRRPMTYVRVHDLPGLLAAVEQSALGRLLAEPDVAEAFALGRQRYLEQVRRWTEVAAILRALGEGTSIDVRSELAVRAIDWRCVHSFEFSAILPESEKSGANDPGEFLAGYTPPAEVLALRPTAAGRQRVVDQFARFVADLRARMPTGMKASAQQVVLAGPGLALEPDAEAAQPAPNWIADSPFGMQSFWLVERDGLIAGGNGRAGQLGDLVAFEAGEPCIVLGFDLMQYLRMMFGVLVGFDEQPEVRQVLAALGIDRAGALEWRLHVVDGLVQDDLTLALDGRPGGILGALIEGMAPLPEQPLPDGGMLQVRCTFDVEQLVQAVDELLALAEQRTLTGQGMLDDLRRAWTGGAAFAVGHPAPGGLVPRLYASFGIVDREALGRLLGQLTAATWLEAEARELAERECTLLTIDDFPPALQPSFAVVDGTFHIAESPASLRALLRAKAAGAPAVLDVGDAPQPSGDGARMPNFELRFDGAAIHAALQQVWLPLVPLEWLLGDARPYVPLGEMPDVETVSRHLGCGRGVLRRSAEGITLGMASTLGGPETHALATALGPLVSLISAEGWYSQIEQLRTMLARVQLKGLHAAVVTFEKRAGRRPRTLGELLASGDLADPRLLALPDAKLAEPVVHGERPLATTSYRFYPDGLLVTPTGDDVKAMLIAIEPTSWQRLAIDVDGQIHEGWGEFSELSIDEIERAAKERAKAPR